MDILNFIRQIIAGLVGLGLVILVIVLLIKGFSGGSGTASTQVNVGKYADTAATATLLVDAPTNIDQEHHQIKITVSGTQNQVDVIQGYQGNVLDSRTYNNNAAGFGVFLQAIKLQNFAKGNNDKAAADYRGYCPTGERYIFTFNDGSKNLFTYWTTSCGGGTFKGNRTAMLHLFRQQIPEFDFSQLTNTTALGF
jgi:hypothetical protein